MLKGSRIGHGRTGHRRLTTSMLARPVLATTTMMTGRLPRSFKLLECKFSFILFKL
jgi:hypothetical protein